MEVPAAMSSLVKREDRRQHIRYHVNGSTELEVGEKVYTGFPMNFGLGGMLYKATDLPGEGTTGTMRITITDFDECIVAQARIIRTYETAAAASFLSSPAALVRCVACLAQKDSERQAIAETPPKHHLSQRS